MSTIRLTTELRGQIVVALMDRAFKAREAELDKAEAALAMDVYREAYPARIRKAMSELPQGFFPTTTSIFAKLGGDVVNLHLHDKPAQLLSYDHESGYRTCITVLDARHALTERYRAWNRDQVKLQQERAQAKREAKAAVESASTVARLIAIWPEVAPIVNELLPVKPMLPAIQVSQLNKRFGLPEPQA